MLGKVQLPLARRMLLLGVNQTILFALSMVVIAGLIGGAGLGDAVTSGLYTDPALAILGGAAIVIMAIALDRATEAVADRTDPAQRHLDEPQGERLRGCYTAACSVARRRRGRCSAASCDAGRSSGRAGRRRLAAHLRAAGARLRPEPGDVPLPRSSEPTGNFIVAARLEPLRSFLIGTPWLVTLGGLC